MPGPYVPLSTLRRHPRGRLRMTRGRCGSLVLHRMTLSFTTPRRFSPAHKEPVMGKDSRHLGFDVDSDKIVVALAEAGGEVRSLGTVPYCFDAVRRLVKKLGPASGLRACYEAGPHGYVLCWGRSQRRGALEVVGAHLAA